MKQVKTKVLIVGAGPSGSMAAWRLARLGVQDVLLTDTMNFPRQKPCAGGISPSTVSFLKKVNCEDILQHSRSDSEMGSARLIDSRGNEFYFSGKLKAQVINRTVLDKALLDRAVQAGAGFLPGFTLRELITDNNGRITGATDGMQTIHCEAVLMCTGGHNRSLRERYFTDPRPLRRMTSRMGWWRNFDLPPGQMEMIFDRALQPHYGWVFPEGDGMVNIGICLYEDKLNGTKVTEVFDSFLEKYYSKKLKKARQVGKIYSYPINTTARVKHVVINNMLLCGEAGRMCDPATAEGISFAMESGYLAAETLHRAFSSGELNIDVLKEYETLCKKAFNKRLMASKIFSALTMTPFFTGLLKFSSSKTGKKILETLIPS